MFDANRFPEALWSLRPRERLNAARSMGLESIRDLQAALSFEAPMKPWPYGMPTSANPYVLVIGASPGASPAAGDQGGAYESPSVGAPHPGLFYQDGSGYWKKVRQLAVTLIQSVDASLTESECLGLAGQLNFGTGQFGSASDAPLEPDYCRWVPEMIAHRLRPRYVVLVGLRDKLSRASKKGSFPMASYWPSTWNKPDRSDVLEGYQAKKLLFRAWTRESPAGQPITYIIWPNHPSRAPFTNSEYWEASITQAARDLRP